MATTQDIEAAIAALRASEAPNISAVAREYGIDRSTLSRRFNGVAASREDYDANRQLLTAKQDKYLLNLAKRLTSDGLPPSPKMLRQFAKDLSGELPGKNWAARWRQRHQNELGSKHLPGFDLARKKADNFWQYQAYFNLVFSLGISMLR